MWSKLPEAQKSAYQNRAAKAREQYQAALAEYKRVARVWIQCETCNARCPRAAKQKKLPRRPTPLRRPPRVPPRRSVASSAEINQCVRPAWRYYLLFWPPRRSARVLGVLTRGVLGLLPRTFDFRTGRKSEDGGEKKKKVRMPAFFVSRCLRLRRVAAVPSFPQHILTASYPHTEEVKKKISG